jgi:hypothetical protein
MGASGTRVKGASQEAGCHHPRDGRCLRHLPGGRLCRKRGMSDCSAMVATKRSAFR